jgi:hypothetical protein
MHSHFIVDEKEKKLIVKKLGNHFGIVYGGRAHYGQLWHERKVFK